VVSNPAVGIANVTISLTGDTGVLETTRTDSLGAYQFDGLAFGT
jgi:hypothetical protein